MSHYRKIDVRIWNDARFISLTFEGRMAWMMLLTHPMMTAIGAIRATPDGLASELSFGADDKTEAFREAFRDVIAKGMVRYDAKASLMWLPNFLKYNKPESPNVVRAWAKAVEMLPECGLKDQAIQQAVGYAKGFGEGFRKAIGEAFPYTESSEQRTESKEPRAKIQPTHPERRHSVGSSTHESFIDADGVIHDFEEASS
jgi:hypothetical protein